MAKEKKDHLQLYLKIATNYALELSDVRDRLRAIKWIRKISTYKGLRKTQLKAVQLLILSLSRKKLVQPFSLKTDREFENYKWHLYQPSDITKFIIRDEYENAKEMPVKIDLTGDLCEFVSYQEIPFFGAHFFYAYSPESIFNWNNLDRKIIPRSLIYKPTLDSPNQSLLKKALDNSICEKRHRPARIKNVRCKRDSCNDTAELNTIYKGGEDMIDSYDSLKNDIIETDGILPLLPFPYNSKDTCYSEKVLISMNDKCQFNSNMTDESQIIDRQLTEDEILEARENMLKKLPPDLHYLLFDFLPPFLSEEERPEFEEKKENLSTNVFNLTKLVNNDQDKSENFVPEQQYIKKSYEKSMQYEIPHQLDQTQNTSKSNTKILPSQLQLQSQHPYKQNVNILQHQSPLDSQSYSRNAVDEVQASRTYSKQNLNKQFESSPYRKYQNGQNGIEKLCDHLKLLEGTQESIKNQKKLLFDSRQSEPKSEENNFRTFIQNVNYYNKNRAKLVQSNTVNNIDIVHRSPQRKSSKLVHQCEVELSEFVTREVKRRRQEGIKENSRQFAGKESILPAYMDKFAPSKNPQIVNQNYGNKICNSALGANKMKEAIKIDNKKVINTTCLKESKSFEQSTRLPKFIVQLMKYNDKLIEMLITRNYNFDCKKPLNETIQNSNGRNEPIICYNSSDNGVNKSFKMNSSYPKKQKNFSCPLKSNYQKPCDHNSEACNRIMAAKISRKSMLKRLLQVRKECQRLLNERKLKAAISGNEFFNTLVGKNVLFGLSPPKLISPNRINLFPTDPITTNQ